MKRFPNKMIYKQSNRIEKNYYICMLCCNLFYLKLIIKISMNSTSFQGSNYNHFQQMQVLGTSRLKIQDR